MTLFGGFITIVVGVIIAAVLKVVSQPEWLGRQLTASDNRQLYVIFGALGLVLALGLTFVVAGAWQIVYARRNRFLIWVALFLIVVIFGGSEVLFAFLAQ